MKPYALIALGLLAFAVLSFAQDTTAKPPLPGQEWRQQTFSAPPDAVFQAARIAVRHQGHDIKAQDEDAHTIEFHVGTTAWSWGYNMVLQVEPTGSGGSLVKTKIKKSGGDAFSWGSGKKEVKKIYDGIEAELKKSPAQPTSKG